LVQEKKENAGRRFYARVEEQFVLDGFPETWTNLAQQTV
jgi:hypothetical protein